jgi:hypothetical protein
MKRYHHMLRLGPKTSVLRVRSKLETDTTECSDMSHVEIVAQYLVNSKNQFFASESSDEVAFNV